MNVNVIGSVPGNVNKQSSARVGTVNSPAGDLLIGQDIAVFELTAIGEDYCTLSIQLWDPGNNWNAGVVWSQSMAPSSPDQVVIVQVDGIPPRPTGDPADHLGWAITLTSDQESSPSDWYYAVYA